MLLDRRWQDGRSPRGIDECRTVLIGAGIMAKRVLETRVENLEHRVATVEQILPTLATKADLTELKTSLKAEVRAESEQTRRHFDVVAEGMRAEDRKSVV